MDTKEIILGKGTFWDSVRSKCDRIWADEVNRIVKPAKLKKEFESRYEICPEFFDRLFFGPDHHQFRSHDEIKQLLSRFQRVYHHHSQIMACESGPFIDYMIPMDVFLIRLAFKDECFDVSNDPFSVFYPGTKEVSQQFNQIYDQYRKEIWTLALAEEGCAKDKRIAIDSLVKNFDPSPTINTANFPNISFVVRRKGSSGYDACHCTDLIFRTQADSYEQAKTKVDSVGKRYIVKKSHLGACSA